MKTNFTFLLGRFFLLLWGLSLSVLYAQDTIPPVINLNPGSNQSIELNCTNPPYVDPGATAYDLRDGNLTYGIKVWSNVNTRRPGKYYVRYTVSDFSGNKTTVDRVVVVESARYPIHFDAYNNGPSFLFTTYQITPARISHNWMLDGDTLPTFKDEIAMITKLKDGKDHEVCIVEKYCDGDTSLKYCEWVSDTMSDARWVTFQTFRDLNSNCIKDNDEQSYFQFWNIFDDTGKIVPIMFAPDGSIGYAMIDTNTRYRIPVYLNTIDTFNLSCFGHDTIIAPQTYKDTIMHLTLAFSCKPRLSDYEVWGAGASGRVFPGQTFQVYASSGNRNFYSFNNCNRPDSGYLVYTLYGKGRFKSVLGSSLRPDTFTAKKVVIKVDNLNLINKAKYAAFNIYTDTSAKAGDSISLQVEIICPNAESDKSNNRYFRHFTVANSYDPNMKSVSHEKVTPGFEDWLTYKIDFQNTGTAEAINIVLRDTLDPGLDVNSFMYLDASHSVQSFRAGNVLRFEFDNINLPDSGTDQAGSHGFVIYKVKPLTPMLLNQSIRNTAYIYFDFNDPVVTNTALTYAFVSNGHVSSAATQAFKLWPNPTQAVVNFESLHFQSGQASLTDVYGKLLHKLSFDAYGRIDMTELPAGVYILQLSSSDQTIAYKLIKQ